MRPSKIINEKRYYILDPLDRFEEGKGRRYEINGVNVAAFLLGKKVLAVAGECPHEGASMAEGWIADDCVTCPRHGWQFKTADGSPRFPEDCPIAWYETVVEDDAAWITLP